MTKKTISEQPTVVSEQPSVVSEPGKVEMIELFLLDASPINPRKTFDQAALKELAQSIQSIGITQPLLVRPRRSVEVEFEGGESISTPFQSREECAELLLRPGVVRSDVDDRYEIIAGHRRSAAAAMAGLVEVPCIVREMTDAEAADTAFIDNAQRVDVGAIEEAEAFGELLARHGSIEAVAAKVGKEVSHVAKRLKLRSLGIYQTDALRERLITVDHALLLARLGIDQQDKALKWLLDPQAGVKSTIDKVLKERLDRVAKERKRREEGDHWRKWECESPQRLKEHIERTAGRKLSLAPWDLDAVNLNEEGTACASCPANTKANTSLFGDLDIEEATCADGECFERKREAFVHIQLAAAGEDVHAKPAKYVPRLSWKSSSVKPATQFNDITAHGAMTSTARPDKVLRDGQWVAAKKGSCPNVRTGVTVDWNEPSQYGGGDKKKHKPGEALLVCIAVGCKVHRKEYEKPKSQNNGSHREDPKAEAERQEKVRLAALAETRLRVRLAGEAIERVKTLPIALLRRILLDRLPNGSELEALNAVCPGLENTLKNAKIESVEFARAFATATLEGRHVEVWQYWEPTQFRREFIKDLADLGYDASKAWDVPKVAKPASPKAATTGAVKPALKPAAKKAAVKAAPKKAAKRAVKKAAKKAARR